MSADFREPLTLLISAHLRALSVPTFGVIVELWRINAGPIKVSMEKASTMTRSPRRTAGTTERAIFGACAAV
jgi:hypothetical protein